MPAQSGKSTLTLGCCRSAELTALDTSVAHCGTSTLTSVSVHFGQVLASSAFIPASICAVADAAFDVIATASNGCPLCCETAWSTASVASSVYGSELAYW